MVDSPSWFREWLAQNPDIAAAVRQQVRERVVQAMADPSAVGGLEKRVAARKRMIDFAAYTYPLYVAEAWNRILADTLDQVVAGKIRRLIVSAPPQHGKSHLASVLFPAYWLGRRPDDPVILTSYAGSLATDKSRQARAIVESREFNELFPSIRTAPRHRSVEHWQIHNRLASLLAVGVGGAITGHGARLGIVDDPFSGWQDAYRETVRDRIWDWYRGTFRTRIWENGVIIIIMTRWHQDDLVGRLIADQSESWHILRLPALAETQEERDINNKFVGLAEGLPDPIGREAGEPLSPLRFSRAALLEIMREVGSNAWAAEYQGVPRPTEGSLFRRPWFKLVDAVPLDAQRVRYWDLASGESMRNDQTAGVLMAKTPEGFYYVEDVVCGRYSAYEVQQVILQTTRLDADKYRNTVEVWVEQEGGSGGKISTDAIIRLLAGHPVYAQRALTNKEVAAKPFAAQAEAGNVRVLRANWTADWLDEITAFPFGRNDDQVDGSSGAFNKLSAGIAFSYGFA
ncbi:MAG: phage terminase large subunit [Anaerolineae bacterium]|nr:phage terminase large subunit [Anaerolineae bacterium]